MESTDHIVGLVPSHIVTSTRARTSANGGRIADYNVAAWLQLHGMAKATVTLLATYRDGGQKHEVIIDHGATNDHGKILLSGIARLPYTHNVEDLQIRLRAQTSLSRLIVDELFVQAVAPAESGVRSLAS